MHSLFGAILFAAVIISGAVAVFQLVKKDYSSLGEVVGRILLAVLFLYLHLK